MPVSRQTVWECDNCGKTQGLTEHVAGQVPADWVQMTMTEPHALQQTDSEGNEIHVMGVRSNGLVFCGQDCAGKFFQKRTKALERGESIDLPERSEVPAPHSLEAAKSSSAEPGGELKGVIAGQEIAYDGRGDRGKFEGVK